jgi:hypothetical protein
MIQRPGLDLSPVEFHNGLGDGDQLPQQGFVACIRDVLRNIKGDEPAAGMNQIRGLSCGRVGIIAVYPLWEAIAENHGEYFGNIIKSF